MNSDIETAMGSSSGRLSHGRSNPEERPIATSTDNDIIGWKDNDPENPLNWPGYKRGAHITIIGFMTLGVNLAATMFAPAAGDLAQDFSVTSSTVISLTVSVYMLGFAIGPLLIAPISEIYGRFWIYNVCNLCFLAMSIGCAAAPNLAGFMAFRFLAGAAGSAPITIGGGTIADVTTPESRAKAMSGFVLGPLLGPVLGPIIGGFVGADVGWRWTLWIIAILSGVNCIVCISFMRETYAPIILGRRATRLSKESSGQDLQVARASPAKMSALILRASTKALSMLFTSPIVFLLSLFSAFTFGLMFLLFTTFTEVFTGQYNFSTGTAGLSYLGLGVGMFAGLFVFGATSKKIIKPQDVPFKPERRLIPMMYTAPLLATGIFWYGWAAEAKVHWIVPIIGTSFIGFGIFFIMMPIQLYLVDVFGAQGAASALAALAVFRCFFAAFLPLAGPAMYTELGYGWGNSILGFVAVAFIPVPVFFYKYGERLRTKARENSQ